MSSDLHYLPSAGTAIAAKLNPPRAARVQVRRTGIAARAAEAMRARLVLVRGPAGFGKTTAMRQLREHFEAAGLATAWLTLDAADNDLARFLQGLGRALQLAEGPSPASDDPFVTLEVLAREQVPFALFLDDFELLHDAAVLGLIRQLAEQLPQGGRLVIGSRALPVLGLGRLRARGQLLEIDPAVLRFSESEAQEFFKLRGLPLPREALVQLLQKTEGWIGALWLASLALERHGPHSDFVQRFSGSERAVADYLAEDVLAQQGEEVRAFLLRTSILRTLDAQVCQALMPRTDCTAMLAQLEAANLFLSPLSPLSDNAHSYRYHSLFADFLRAQLQRERPDEFARLHLAASAWYEAAGRPVPAIEHALQGGDPPHAVQLLSLHAQTLLEQGRMRLLARWFDALPRTLLADQPLLQAVAVYAHCFTSGAWQAQQQLDESSACLASPDAPVQAHVNALQPLLLAMMDRVEEALPVGRAALARLPSCRPFADSTLANAMAYVVSVMGEPGEAQRLLDAARRTQGASLFSRMYTEAMAGVIDLAEGRRRQAAARFRVALAATPRAASYNPTHGNAWAGVLHAGMLYESNELDAADHLLNVYLPLARDVGLPDHVIASYRMRTRIAFLRGDIDAAFGLMTELEYLGQQRQLPRVSASAKLELARIFTLQGNRQAAADALARADDPAVWPRVQRLRFAAHEVDDLAIARLRWTLRFGSIEAVRAMLSAELPALRAQAQSRGRRHRELKLQVLTAMAQARAEQEDEAQQTLAGVMHEAAREGFARLLLDEGPLLVALLRRLHARLIRDEAVDPLVLDHTAQLVAAGAGTDDMAMSPSAPLDPRTPRAQALPSKASAAVQVSTALGLPAGMEPLTRKEIRVLELLAAGYSNAAMAEKLFVSDSTVRTHLRNINAKLGARSRTQAVALARSAGVLR